KERSFCSVTCGYAFVVWRSRKDARNHLAAKRNLRRLVLQTGRGTQPCRHDYNQAGHHYAGEAQASLSHRSRGLAAQSAWRAEGAGRPEPWPARAIVTPDAPPAIAARGSACP